MFQILCSMLCVLIYEKDNPERMRHYNKLNDTIINWGCMKFPCSIKYIDRFEELNQGLISANVYKLFNGTTITDRITKVKTAEHHINQLMIGQEDNCHHVLIKYLSKLVGCQYNKTTNKKHLCPHCLRGFQTIETLNSHITNGCLAIEGQQIKMPKEGEHIHFKNDFRKFESPFVLYADFECLTMEYSSKISKPLRDSCESYTEKYQHHKPCGYKINVVNRITNESESSLYHGSDCMEHVVKTCRHITNKIMNKLKDRGRLTICS